jgi:hypothetical protein
MHFTLNRVCKIKRCFDEIEEFKLTRETQIKIISDLISVIKSKNNSNNIVKRLRKQLKEIEELQYAVTDNPD